MRFLRDLMSTEYASACTQQSGTHHNWLWLSLPSLHGTLLVLITRNHLVVRLGSLLLQMCRQLGVAPPKQQVDIKGPTCRVGPAAAFCS